MDADEVILERLKFLRNEINYLQSEHAKVRSFRKYSENMRLKKAVERGLHTAIESCLDIGRRIIAIEEFRQPSSNQEVFHILAEEKIISADLLETLIDMSRFRNLIVHEYTRIDDAKVYAILTRRLGDFDSFAEAIRMYLQSQ